MDLSQIEVPAAFPDNEITRGDVADYFVEVQRYDTLVGDAVKALEQAGLLENTIIVMTSDHGMPFPRGKSNLYDLGVRVPLAIRWPGTITPGSNYEGFVSFTDFAPTFLQAAGIDVPLEMTGHDLAPELLGNAKPRKSW
jgi:arylsulfatase A-like enzyme